MRRGARSGRDVPLAFRVARLNSGMAAPGWPIESAGFSLIELLIATVITTLVMASTWIVLSPASGAFQMQPEATDVQQRVRTVSDALLRDLLVAGGQPYLVAGGEVSTPLQAAALIPARVGRSGADAAGSAFNDRLFSWSVSAIAPQAVLAGAFASASGSVTVTPGSGCHDLSSCGFRLGMTVGIFGGSGLCDLFVVTGVTGFTLALQHVVRDSPFVHPPGSPIAEVMARVFQVRTDPATGAPRLVRQDAASTADVPVADHVTGMSLAYFGEAEPPMPVIGSNPAAPPRVTYGPVPPLATSRPTTYPLGENCAFARGPSGTIVPRLSTLAAGPALVALPLSSFSDGPWCPDSADPNRYDADLLRVRHVVVSLRVEAAIDSLRGPAGTWFSRAGTARSARTVPDRVIRVSVTPRLLNLGH